MNDKKRGDLDQQQEDVNSLRARVRELEETNRNLETLQVNSKTILQAMDVINEIIASAADLDDMLDQVLSELLNIFSCERAWLLFPCDPNAETWHVPKQRTRPEWQVDLEEGIEVPMEDFTRQIFNEALANPGAVRHDSQANPFTEFDKFQAQYSIRSQLIMAIYPKIGKPWLMGFHHCVKQQTYSDADCVLFEVLCARVCDSLSSLLHHRETIEIEKKLNAELEDRVEQRTRDLESSRHQLVQAQAVGHIGSWSRDIVSDKENWSAEQFRIFGYEPNEIIPTYQLFLDAIHPEDRTIVTTTVEKALKNHEAYDLDFRIIDAKNKLRLVRAQGEFQRVNEGNPLVLVGTVQDITERSALEASIVQTGKMATLGEMATGIAHEINQPLNAIQLATSNLLNKAKNGDVSEDYLFSKVNKIQKMTERAGSIINHMKIFGRTDTKEKSVVSISACVKGAIALVRHQFQIAEIDVDVDYPSIPLNVLGHQIQFEQVFLNLLTNAKQAIEGSESENQRHINISFLNDEKNSEVEVSLTDTGGGISSESLDQIFEPFYTTKEVGVGTGLGLSITYGIIKESGGEIRAENTADGARFVITLPLANKT